MTCKTLQLGAVTFFWCGDPEDMFHAWMARKCEQEQREEEREQDLARQLELHPPTEVQEPDAVCAAVVEEWDAYA